MHQYRCQIDENGEDLADTWKFSDIIRQKGTHKSRCGRGKSKNINSVFDGWGGAKTQLCFFGFFLYGIDCALGLKLQLWGLWG